jgi:hypothetical protein
VGAIDGERVSRARSIAGAFWRRVLGAAVFVGLTHAAPASAAELSASGPDGCPDAAELGFRVERAIGMPLAQSVPLRFVVVFEAPRARPGRYTARLQVAGDAADATGTEREISALDCGGLADAVSVAIALAIGSTPAQDATAFESKRVAAAQIESSVSGAVTSAGGEDLPDPEPAETENVAFTPVMAFSMLADRGSLPALGLGVSLGAELRWPQVALRANGALLFDQHVALEGGSGAPGADMSLVLGSLSACTAAIGHFRAALALFACAGWELGRITAVGTGVTTPRRGDQLWSAPRLDAGVSWAAPGTAFRFNLQLSAAAPLKRDDFFLRDLGRIHHPPAAVGRLALGVDVSFE